MLAFLQIASISLVNDAYGVVSHVSPCYDYISFILLVCIWFVCSNLMFIQWANSSFGQILFLTIVISGVVYLVCSIWSWKI